MSDPFKHVTPGQPLKGNIAAVAWNAMLDAGKAQTQKAVASPPMQRAFRQSGIVLIKNDTGADLDRFGVVVLDAPIILPANNESVFAREAAFSAVEPDGSHEVTGSGFAGQVGIALDPIPAGKFGRATVDGVTPALIYCTEDQDSVDVVTADAESGRTDALVPNAAGSIQVLWIAPAVDLAYPENRWAIVRLCGTLVGVVDDPVDLTFAGEHPPEVDEDDEAWDIEEQDEHKGIIIPVSSGPSYDHTATPPKLYDFRRNWTFDSRGRLVAVSAETRTEIDAPGPCDEEEGT